MDYRTDCGDMDSLLSCYRWTCRPKKLGSLLRVTSKLTPLEQYPAQGRIPHTPLPVLWPTLLTAHLSLLPLRQRKARLFLNSPHGP